MCLFSQYTQTLSQRLCCWFILANASASFAENTAVESFCNRDISQQISRLVDFSSVTFGGVNIGLVGEQEGSLMQALQLTHLPKRLSASGLELGSDLENHLISAIGQHKCFTSFARVLKMGQGDISGNNRATLRIAMPLAVSQVYNVEYLKNKIRRNFLFQIALTIELRDNEGKLVFIHSYTGAQRRTCFWERRGNKPTDCLDFENQTINQQAQWRAVFNSAIDNLLIGANRELPLWSNILEGLTGRFFDKRYRQQRQFDGHSLRHNKQLDIPYLFVLLSSENIHIEPLLQQLQAYGFDTGSKAGVNLHHHYKILFRNALELHLRRAIAQRQQLRQVRVLMLSDTQTDAFQQAMMISCAQQSKAYTQQDCRRAETLFNNLCIAHSPKQIQGNIYLLAQGECARVYLMLANPVMDVNKHGLQTVREARQRVDAASFIHLINMHKAPKQMRCYNQALSKNTLSLVGKSEKYYRVDGQIENDDAIYLLDAATGVVQAQAACVAQRLLGHHQLMSKQ